MLIEVLARAVGFEGGVPMVCLVRVARKALWGGPTSITPKSKHGSGTLAQRRHASSSP